MKLSLTNKIVLSIFLFGVAIAGFMIKLPSMFHYTDKILHTAFYFLAAAFLNMLFNNKKVAIHISIFVLLYLFGIGIEYAQEYSNKLLHKRIHGRYDPVDVAANLKGLVLYSAVWAGYAVISFLYNRIKLKHVEDKLK